MARSYTTDGGTTATTTARSTGVAWEIKGVGGVIPRTDPRLIADNMAVEAVNCDLTGGQFTGLPQPKFLVDLSDKLPVVERAYRLPATADDPELWLALPSRYSSVVRSPLANDSFDRVYWTNPGDISPHVNTRERIRDGLPHYDLGSIYPTTALTITEVTGGTDEEGAVTEIDRSYTYTYVNIFNEESAPAPSSEIVSGLPDATWTVTGLPMSAPANLVDRAYPAVVSMNLYRTITSETEGAQFYFVKNILFPNTSSTYVDDVKDDVITSNNLLETIGYRNPPDYLDGLVSMPGEFLAGFVGNTVSLTEPDRPYAWPDLYDFSADYEIVAIAPWQQYLQILTKGYPSSGTGTTPSNFLLTQTQAPEPCIARGSVVVQLSGVFYASQNGMIQFIGYEMSNITSTIIEKNEWLERYHARDLIACQHRTQLMAINGTDIGFIIDYAEARLAVEDLSTMKDVVCVWNDEFTGDTLMCANGRIYEWDSPGEPSQIYRWKSKQFFTPLPLSLGAVQITLDPAVEEAAPTEAIPLDNGDEKMQLPAGVNAQFRYYAGPKLTLIMTRDLTRMQEIFRLPNGFKAFDHQAEVTARVPIYSIQLATTLDDLKSA